ncbi:MAG: type II toxin-antitoxin system HicB family antitoxin [Defluviitaleaceae bacterium]|nr:type II toxin-antitoxin system HicB family antitoxin [Defluviitaleaceae bacterium]
MFKDTYVFPSIFIYSKDGIHIYFPDLDGCVSFGENEQQACHNAKEVLSLHIYGMEQDNEKIPEPSTLFDMELEKNERLLFIDVFMPTFRAKQDNKSVNKTLTLPRWLNIEAECAGVNFSQILQTALKEHLGISK